MDKDGKFEVPTADAEFKLTGTKTDIRMGAKSDPICSSAGCTQYEHPHKKDFKKDYFVPNFGKDHDLKTSDESAADAETALGHTFTPKFDEEKDEWIVPTESAEFKLAGVKEDVHLGRDKVKGSDPSCTSSGWCGESLWPKHRAKEDEHDVLRTDTRRGANQVPSENDKRENKIEKVEFEKNEDPHPHTEEPEPDSFAQKHSKPDPDDESCKSRKKSSEISDDEWKKCHSNVQKGRKDPDDESCKKRKESSVITDDEWKKCHSEVQRGRKGDDDDSCKKRKKSSEITDEEW